MADNIFPINWGNKINSPDLLAYFQQFGDEHFITAEQINQVTEALNSLNTRVSNNSDGLKTNAGFSVVGNAFNLNAGNIWEIFGNIFSNSTLVTKPISFSSAGMKKQCIALLNDQNTFYLKYGPEHATSPPKPVKDNGTIELTVFTIGENSIGNPSVPVIGDPFILKNQFNESGDINGRFYIYQQSNFVISNPEISVVRGISMINNSEENLYPGKLHYWTNLLSTPVWFPHMDTSDPLVQFPFYFSEQVGFELKPGQTIVFFHSTVNLPLPIEYGYLRFFSGPPRTYSKPQITVTGNTSANNDWNGAIVKVKSSAIITIPSGLIKGFEFDYATFIGATATLLTGVGVTLNSPNGLILHENKIGTIFNDTLNTYEVRGEQTTS